MPARASTARRNPCQRPSTAGRRQHLKSIPAPNPRPRQRPPAAVHCCGMKTAERADPDFHYARLTSSSGSGEMPRQAVKGQDRQGESGHQRSPTLGVCWGCVDHHLCCGSPIEISRFPTPPRGLSAAANCHYRSSVGSDRLVHACRGRQSQRDRQNGSHGSPGEAALARGHASEAAQAIPPSALHD